MVLGIQFFYDENARLTQIIDSGRSPDSYSPIPMIIAFTKFICRNRNLTSRAIIPTPHFFCAVEHYYQYGLLVKWMMRCNSLCNITTTINLWSKKPFAVV